MFGDYGDERLEFTWYINELYIFTHTSHAINLFYKNHDSTGLPFCAVFFSANACQLGGIE